MTLIDMSLSKLQEIVNNREAWRAAVHVVAKSWKQFSMHARTALLIVMVFTDQDLGTGVEEKRDTGDPSLEWNKSVLFAETPVYISSYKAALGSKNIEQKQSQANNSLQRARKHSISWVRGV